LTLRIGIRQYWGGVQGRGYLSQKHSNSPQRVGVTRYAAGEGGGGGFGGLGGGELREKMVEFATVMRNYSETIAAKNTAYVESTRKTIDVISSHIETVRTTIKAVAPERATISADDAHIEKAMREALAP